MKALHNHIGEIIQHGFSHHSWSPFANEKWYLITFLDDFSPFILYTSLSNQRDFLEAYPGLRVE